MLQALQAAREKLSVYYKMTDHECYGDIYAIATILAPSKKLRFFKTKDWQGDVDLTTLGDTVVDWKRNSGVTRDGFQITIAIRHLGL